MGQNNNDRSKHQPVELSVVMPAYNEGDKIYKNAHKVSDVISQFAKSYEIVVVDDGSMDNTKDEVTRAAKEDHRIRLITYEKNGGKGKAVRMGIKDARGVYIAMLDADLDLPPEQLAGYLDALRKNEADVVIGSKMHRDSKIDYPMIRRVLSFGYYCFLKILFHMDVKDTQTGIKMFKSRAIKPVIRMIRTKGYAFDIEILAALNARGCRIKEMPVELVFTRGKGMGRIHMSDIFKMAADTLKIHGRVRRHEYS